ncbi:MAG: cysteine--tRNA ligase [Marine Group I thaumarchaeote]|nr:MAG: cysteine--tRNA ligase [Marine Group I thaumarchaeote]
MKSEKMKILDTLSGAEKELESGKVRIYLCGVTVYDESHIGHARTLIVFDVLRRYLESKGMEIEFIQNFTDVDDKIINRAKRENVRASAISSRYIQEYYDEFDALNVKRATKYPKATEHIQDMLDLVQDLVDKKIAYVSKNGVYFSVSKFPEYGKLSKKKVEDLQSGARVEVDEAKNDPLDFALWKFSESDPSWDSPWGRGRPGWHIECSTMSLKYLGENFEIHGGGRDLIFPHHENEIAQSESHTSKPFAKIWMHVGMITINGEKMSKSLGNIKSVKNLIKAWSPNVLRIFCISSHYSKPIDYSEELLKEHETNWDKARLAYHKLIQAEKDGEVEDVEKTLSQLKTEFSDALDNNLNTHMALSAFYRLATFCLSQEDHLTKSAAGKIILIFDEMMQVLGLKIAKVTDDEKSHIQILLKQREEFRHQKKYEDADGIRAKLDAKGIELKDEVHQTIWMKKEKIHA